MAAASPRGTNDALIGALESIGGVLRVWVDADDTVWVVAQTVAERNRVRAEAAQVVEQHAAGSRVVVAAVEDEVDSFRVRFEGIERTVARDGSVSFKVQLAWRGEQVSAEVRGEGGEPLELRSAAQATVSALEKLTSQSLGLRLVGVKRVHVFDADLVVVSFLRSTAPRHLVGTVAATANAANAAALAVLDALNRLLGTILSAKE